MNPRTHAYIILDFETGGLDPKKNPITQVGFISITGDTFREINRYFVYIKPYDSKLKYEEKALKMTRTTMEDLNSGEDIHIVSQTMFNLFQEANVNNTKLYKPILVGHNLGAFDIGFLHQISFYTQVDWSLVLDGHIDYYGNFKPNFLDTQYLARLKWGNDLSMERHKLSFCCEKAGVDLVDAHNAENDVIATKDLFIYDANNLRNEETVLNNNVDTFRKHFSF